MNVHIFDKPGCPKCRMTERAFKRLGVDVEIDTLFDESDTRSMELTEKTIPKLKERYASFPIVTLKDDLGNVLDEWCDLRVDKINKYFRKSA